MHCDGRASSYLRMLLDSIFGSVNFRNLLTWHRARGKGLNPTRYLSNCDQILFFAKGRRPTWNQQFEPYEEEYGANWRTDEIGAWESADLTGGRRGGAEAYLPFKGIYPTTGRAWAPPPRSKFPPEIQGKLPDNYEELNQIQKCEALDAAGAIYWPAKRNGKPRYKKYLSTLNGRYVSDLIVDIRPIQAHAKERTGYSTQKPVELYERLIAASSNPGDVVLDVFAGCATTAVAAERLGRRWVACDMAYRSWTMLKRRFYQNGFALTDMTDSTQMALGEHQIEMQEAQSQTIGPDNLPKRTDTDPLPFHHLALTRNRRRSSTQSATWSGRIPKDEAKQLLINRFGPVCWGCGYEPRRPNGTLDHMLLEVDHIRARKASEGVQGDDELYNLALLHRTCNSRKRNKLTLEELRNDNALNGRLYVNTMNELVDLFEAQQFAVAEILKRGEP